MKNMFTFFIFYIIFHSNMAFAKYNYEWTEKHPAITKYIDKHKNKIIKNTIYKLKISKEFLPDIERIFQEEGVPKEIALLASVESSFRADAVSKSDAVGMWQFKKETALEWGLIVNDDIDERLDWKKSSRAAAKYIKWLAEENFDGNYETAILSYNAGIGYIKNIMELMDIDNPWVLLEYEDILNKENREFLPKFIIYMQYFYHLKEKEKRG